MFAILGIVLISGLCFSSCLVLFYLCQKARRITAMLTITPRLLMESPGIEPGPDSPKEYVFLLYMTMKLQKQKGLFNLSAIGGRNWS
jgi:hypothetical protein